MEASNQLQEQHKALIQENLQLRDRNEQLSMRLGHLESRLGHLDLSNTELCSRLVQGEEDRLKISKELVEGKIQTNNMREQYEEETFELKTKLLEQDAAMTELQTERDRLCRELRAAQASLSLKEQKDLTEGYNTLRKNYLLLTEEHQREVAKSDQLGAELLTLAQTQDALRRRVEEQQQSVQTTTQDLHGELSRVQVLVRQMAQDRVKPEDLAALDKEHKTMEETLLGNQDEIRGTLEKMKRSYEDQRRKLEEKVVTMGGENQERNNREIHMSQKLSEHTAALMCAQSQVKEVEEENSKLQQQVKELNEEYRERLVCYLRDMSDYIDGVGEAKGPSQQNKMREFVDSMLQRVGSSFRVREEQLASAARSYKKRLQKVTTTHHALLIAYRVQREQILAKPAAGLDPGPPEAHFNLEPSELREEVEKEVQLLRQDKARLEARLQTSVSEVPTKILSCQEPSDGEQRCEESRLDVREQLRAEAQSPEEVNPEKERVLLLCRATVAEAQVLELQDYIHNHLDRYKQEITRLSKIHEKEEARC